MNKKFLTIFVVFFLLMSFNECFAQTEMRINANKNVIQKNEDFAIQIEINDIAALTLEIYWDNTKLEYIKGPDNSNQINGRILYTWVSDTGKNNNITTEEFVFKGIEEGIGNIVVLGEAYNTNGERVEINNKKFGMQIGNNVTEIMPLSEEEIVLDNNANLQVLRLDREGISPEFSKDIDEYYFIADETVDSLTVTAIPENSGATVTVTGNDTLKPGKNTITIKVESTDKNTTKTYQIYVTKTDNVQRANANLENLAAREATLNPEFDNNVTKYNIEIANEVNTINILAVPQNENATINIVGNEEMNIGDNLVEVIVLAEDGITSKKYEITVHRRNTEEEVQHDQEEVIEAERLSIILEEKEAEQENRNDEATEEQTKNNPALIISSIVIVTAIISGIIYYIKKKK